MQIPVKVLSQKIYVSHYHRSVSLTRASHAKLRILSEKTGHAMAQIVAMMIDKATVDTLD